MGNKPAGGFEFHEEARLDEQVRGWYARFIHCGTPLETHADGPH